MCHCIHTINMTPGSSELGHPQANIKFAQMQNSNRICFLQGLAWLPDCSQPRVCPGVSVHLWDVCYVQPLLLPPAAAPSTGTSNIPACGSAQGMPSNSSSSAVSSKGTASPCQCVWHHCWVKDYIWMGIGFGFVLGCLMELSQGIPGIPRPSQKLKRPQWNIHKPWWCHIWRILSAVSSALAALSWFSLGLEKQRLIATYSLFWRSPVQGLGKYYCNEELTDI